MAMGKEKPLKTVGVTKSARAIASSPVDASEQKRIKRVYGRLTELYPHAKCALIHRNAFELLVATILSAQCTDARVNIVTPRLFAAYPDAKAMAGAEPADLEEIVKSTGFYRNKAKALKAASQAIVQRHGGKVPDTMEQLLELNGVARKTANVVLGNAFGKNEGMVVDTHIARLSYRLGFTTHKDPKKIELDLMARFPRETWTILSHLLISHGRTICKAPTPLCEKCALLPDCPQVGVTAKKAAGAKTAPAKKKAAAKKKA
jgi:endonuclease-3